MNKKYAVGTPINSPKYKGQLKGKLVGKLILEIPESNKVLQDIQRYLEIAKKHGIEIRFRPE